MQSLCADGSLRSLMHCARTGRAMQPLQALYFHNDYFPVSFMGKSGAVSGTQLESEQGYESLAHAVVSGGHSAAHVKPK